MDKLQEMGEKGWTTDAEELGELADKITIHTPENPHMYVYRLSDAGRRVYRLLYNKEAVRPENPAHYFGMLQTADMFQSLMPDAKVTCRDRKIRTGERTSYTPDIVISRNKTVYVEYETGTDTDTDIRAKECKMHPLFVVPDQEIKSLVKAEQVFTYNEIRFGSREGCMRVLKHLAAGEQINICEAASLALLILHGYAEAENGTYRLKR